MPLRRGTIAEATPRVHQTPRAKEFGYAVGYVPRVAAAYWVRLLGGHDDPEPAHFSSNVQPAPGDRAGSEEHRPRKHCRTSGFPCAAPSFPGTTDVGHRLAPAVSAWLAHGALRLFLPGKSPANRRFSSGRRDSNSGPLVPQPNPDATTVDDEPLRTPVSIGFCGNRTAASPHGSVARFRIVLATIWHEAATGGPTAVLLD